MNRFEISYDKSKNGYNVRLFEDYNTPMVCGHTETYDEAVRIVANYQYAQEFVINTFTNA